MKTYADKDEYEKLTPEHKRDVINIAMEDAANFMLFLNHSKISMERFINASGHLFGILMLSGEIDEEDLRSFHLLCIQSAKCYGKMMEEEGEDEK